MQVPKGFEIPGSDASKYVLKLNRNVYGQKQTGRVWNKSLEEKLIKKVGFKQSAVDDCKFYKNRTMFVLYTDNSILAVPLCEKDIQTIIQEIKDTGLNITEEGDIQEVLGINISKDSGGWIELTQPHLNTQILNDLKMDANRLKVKDTLCISSEILTRRENDKPASTITVSLVSSTTWKKALGAIFLISRISALD